MRSSSADDHDAPAAGRTIEELAAAQGIVPARDPEDLAAPDLWESDEELDEFLAAVRRSRRADLA